METYITLHYSLVLYKCANNSNTITQSIYCKSTIYFSVNTTIWYMYLLQRKKIYCRFTINRLSYHTTGWHLLDQNPSCELYLFQIFPIFLSVFLSHMMQYRGEITLVITQYVFIVRIVCWTSCCPLVTKFCRSCAHHLKDWAGLYLDPETV